MVSYEIFLKFVPFLNYFLGGSAFPGISDLLHEVNKLDAGDRQQRFKEIRKHLSDLMIVLQQAASWLSTEDEI